MLVVFAAAALVLEARVVYLQLIDNEFLSAQGDDRQLRTVRIEPPRGSITDRNGEPLAVSTPVDSIWAVPDEVRPALERLDELAIALDVGAAGTGRPPWLGGLRRPRGSVPRGSRVRWPGCRP
jgi:cell division protein FtsI (penicillin-binding protein 3)